MDRQIVLHIGTHKTGTTSVQHFLSREREGLLTRAGVVYPRGLVIPTAHAELALLTIRPDRMWPARLRFPEVQSEAWLAAAEAHVRAQLASTTRGTIVLSHEDLSYLRYDDELDRLGDLFGSTPVRIVVYLRERSSFLRSYGEQLAATGYEASDDPTSFAHLDADSWLVDYDALLDGYRRRFGADVVEVIDYEDAVRRDGSVLPSFAGRLGIPLADLPSPEASFLNRSGMHLRPTAEQLESIRRRLREQAR